MLSRVLLIALLCVSNVFAVMYDLNTITKEELLVLGVPEDVADSILAFREERKFSSVEELKSIRLVEPFYDMLSRCVYVVKPSDYRIRPGDRLYVFGKETDVLPDGSCVLYDVVMDVGGLTVNQVKEKYYRLTGRELDIVVRKLTGWVYVVGEKGVVKPGNYQASTLLELISLCEVDNAKFSGEILVYRGGLVKRYNFVDLMLAREDYKLYPSDRVYFKKRVFWKVVDTLEPIVKIFRDFAIVWGVYLVVAK